MSFARRLRLYLTGVLLGVIATFFMFHNRGCTVMTPGRVKLDELASQKFFYTDTAKCEMQCNHIDSSDIMQVLRYGKINFKKSKEFVHPCPTYTIDGKINKGKQYLRIVCVNCDSTTRVVQAIDLNHPDKKCDCP